MSQKLVRLPSCRQILTEYDQFDGLGLAKLVKTKQVTPTEVLDAAIAAGMVPLEEVMTAPGKLRIAFTTHP